ncbi:MAG: DPP IV N-terminal domain-containing protein [Ferruginibacter sp.]|nr:DPP IV N-terminal domain-containing protein [Ferruginibacter sp.]
MIMILKKTITFSFLAVVCLSASAQKKELTDEQYFKGNFKGITQALPSTGPWVDESHVVIRRDGKSFLLDCKAGKEADYSNPIVNKGTVPVKPEIITKSGDLYLRKNVGDEQLTFDKDKEVNPTVSPDGNYVAYTKNNNLYTVNLSTKKETKLTTDGSDLILNGYASWVYMEEILGRASQYKSFWWSPNSKNIAYFRSDDTQVPLFTITNADGQHGKMESLRYPKVGDKNPEVKVGVVSPDGGATTWADFNEKDDQYFGMPYWKPDGSSLLVQWMNRLQNNLIIYEVNPTTGSKKEYYNETQKTWIDLDDNDRIQFLNNGKGFILLSDATGWKHLYYHGMDGKRINAITEGKYTVTGLNFVDEKKGIVYFTARSKENSATRDYYKVNLNGKGLQRLTFGNTNHSFINASPNAEYFITTHGNATTPNKMTLVNNKGKIIKELGDAKGADFDTYNLAKTEIIRVKSDDGLYDLPMKITWPLNMEAGKKYPVLISIYGGPDAGTVNDNFTLGGNQQWYAKEGLIQVAMDHRASGHFGKEGVNYMYHNLGDWELKDYATMVKWLIANGSADPKKVCITGFSYGGYMSCLALTKYADVFTHGMAGGSVTDWSLYDSHYTERFMGTPANNAEGYKTGNVMNYVDKYKGMLQIVHGEIDENVHMQNSLQLISKLQDAKKDFEFMIYPTGRHGWGGNKGLHFQNLKTQFIYKYLLVKDVPKQMIK